MGWKKDGMKKKIISHWIWEEEFNVIRIVTCELLIVDGDEWDKKMVVLQIGGTEYGLKKSIVAWEFCSERGKDKKDGGEKK